MIGAPMCAFKEEKMNKYYFTYGTAEYFPFQGGWTIVLAENRQQACDIFRIAHPDRITGRLNCANYYSADYFEKTGMLEGGQSWQIHTRDHRAQGKALRTGRRKTMSTEEKVQAIFDHFCRRNGVEDFNGLELEDQLIVCEEFFDWMMEVSRSNEKKTVIVNAGT